MTEASCDRLSLPGTTVRVSMAISRGIAARQDHPTSLTQTISAAATKFKAAPFDIINGRPSLRGPFSESVFAAPEPGSPGPPSPGCPAREWARADERARRARTRRRDGRELRRGQAPGARVQREVLAGRAQALELSHERVVALGQGARLPGEGGLAELATDLCCSSYSYSHVQWRTCKLRCRLDRLGISRIVTFASYSEASRPDFFMYPEGCS